jgi:hypothetical protein
MIAILNNQYARYAIVFFAGIAMTILLYPSESTSIAEKEKILNETRASYESKLQESEKTLKQERETHQKDIETVRQESFRREQELTTRISSLSTENSSLKQKTKMVTVEKVHPDGTVERKTISTSELESETQVIAQIQREAEEKIVDTVSKLKFEHARELNEKTSVLQTKIDKLSLELNKSESLLKEEREKTSRTTSNPRPFALGLGLNTDRQYTVETHYTFWGPVYVGASYDRGGISNDRAGLSLGIRF